jgi:hypothetical protein
MQVRHPVRAQRGGVVVKLQVPFIQLPLSFDAAVLAAEVAALGEAAWRPHPQGYAGNSALTLITTRGDPESDDVRGAMLPTPHLQRCPYLQQVLGSIGAVWGRTRLMRLSGQAEVQPHIDVNYYWREHMRVHVPILTQPTVRFSCGEAEVNMAAGECWIFDTWRMHRVINDAEQPRIHLVADTVGGDVFWEHVQLGRSPPESSQAWTPRRVGPDSSQRQPLDFESQNLPAVMTPWEMREHFAFLLGELPDDPLRAMVEAIVERTIRRWQALWACHGESESGRPRYRKVQQDTSRALQQTAPQLRLRNGLLFANAVNMIILGPALAAPAR